MRGQRPTINMIRQALASVKGEVLWNEPLSTITSLQVGGPADVLVRPSSVDDVIQVVKGARAHGIPWLVLGGTNVIVRDKGIRGIVMSLNQLTEMKENPLQVLYAQAGVRLPRLMQYAQRRQLSGMEWAAGIPGTVGGAVIMNAGTRLGEMQQVLRAVDLVNTRGKRVRVEAARMSFAYRKTKLPRGVIVGAWMQLKTLAKGKIEAVTKEYLQYRRATQPLTLPNAGSVFINPSGDSAGRLIEAVGLKGCRIGDAEISTKHANFIVNRGEATAVQVLALIRKSRAHVARKLGVHLQLELKVIGES